jgi:hypothetical protein
MMVPIQDPQIDRDPAIRAIAIRAILIGPNCANRTTGILALAPAARKDDRRDEGMIDPIGVSALVGRIVLAPAIPEDGMIKIGQSVPTESIPAAIGGIGTLVPVMEGSAALIDPHPMIDAVALVLSASGHPSVNHPRDLEHALAPALAHPIDPRIGLGDPEILWDPALSARRSEGGDPFRYAISLRLSAALFMNRIRSWIKILVKWGMMINDWLSERPAELFTLPCLINPMAVRLKMISRICSMAVTVFWRHWRGAAPSIECG